MSEQADPEEKKDIETVLAENRYLRERNALLESLLDHAPALLWIKDEDAKIIHCNDAYARLVDQRRSELIDKDAYLRYPDEQARIARMVDQRVLDDNRPLESVETFLVHGQERHFLTLKAPVEIGEKRCIICISIDQTGNISNQRHLKEDLKRQEHTSNIRDRLLMILGHDIRSPMASLVGLCQGVQHGYLNLETHEIKALLGNIGAQSKSMLSMIDNMLVWVRTQQQNLAPKQEAIDLRTLFEQSAELYSGQLSEKSISLTIVKGGPATVYADRDMLDIVVRNLLANSIKFTPKGGSIEIARHFSESSTVAITITDTGVGIDKARIEQLARENNLSARTSGTEKESGLGLGLQLCKDLVIRMEGAIHLERLKIGTRATISLPRIDTDSNLTRLIYRSESVTEFSDRDLVNLARRSSESNSRKGVTGILLHSGGVFIQLLEGHEAIIDELFKAIVKDDRHKNVMLIQREPTNHKLFPNWNMRLFSGTHRVDFSEFMLLSEKAIGEDTLSIEMMDALFRSSKL